MGCVHRHLQEIQYSGRGHIGSHQLNLASLGDIIYLRAFSRVIVVLSSLSAIKDLLRETRGILLRQAFRTNHGHARLVTLSLYNGLPS